MKLRESGLRAIALCVGCVLALLLAEAVLRVASPFEFRLRAGRIVLPVNARYELEVDHPDLDAKVVVTKNAIGFRGPPQPAPGGDEIRLISIGGSTTENLHHNDGETWTDRLASHLESNLAPVWANNAGLDGHSTYGHLVLIEDYVLALQPDLLVFLVGVNDVGHDAPTRFDRDAQAHGLDFSSPKQLLRTLARYSEVFALGLNLYRSYLSFAAGLTRQPDVDETNPFVISSAEAAAITARLLGQNLAKFEARVRRLVVKARLADIEPILVTQPTRFGNVVDPVDQRDLGRIKGLWGLNGAHAWTVMERYNDVTRRVAASESAMLVDLARELPKSRRYFSDSIHFTNTGTREVANIMYRHLCPSLRVTFAARFRGECPR